MSFLGMTLATWGKIAITVASAAYTYYTNKKMMKDRRKTALADDRPNTTTTRGAYLPLLIGRRRVAPIVAWLEGRYTDHNARQRESGGHLLCVGPGSALYRVYKDGKTVFNQTLSPSSAPSGSSFVTSDGDNFTVYWGEETPSVSGVPEALGSRFPRIFYIVWDAVFLNGTYWPEFQFEIEVEAVNNMVVGIDTRVIGTSATVGDYTNIGDTKNGYPGSNYVETAGNLIEKYSGNYALIRYGGEISSDMTTWDVSTYTTYDVATNMNTIHAKDANRGAIKNRTVFPGLGDTIIISFDSSYSGGWRSGDNVCSLEIKVDGVLKYYLHGIQEMTSYLFTPVASESVEFSSYITSLTPSIVGFHFDVEITVNDATQANKAWTLEFMCNRNNTGDEGLWRVKDLEVQAAASFDVRSAVLRDAIGDTVVSEDLTGWDENSSLNGEIEYINSSDPDYETPPAEATSTSQDRMTVTYPNNTTYARKVLTDYPSEGSKMRFSAYVKLSEGRMTVSALDSTGTTTYWYATIVKGFGGWSYVSGSSATAVTLTATTESDWIFVEVVHTVQAAESGYTGLDYSLKIAQEYAAEGLEAWLNDVLFADTSQVTRIELNEEVSFLVDDTGEVAPKISAVVPGANAAGVIYQLLFSEYPYGANQDVNKYDLDSLRTVSALMASEGLPLSIYANEGKTLEAVLANIMQDIGVMIYWDVSIGKFKFMAIRDVTDAGSISTLKYDENIKKRPTIQVDHDDADTNQIMFSYADKDRRYKESTLLYDDDGMVGANYGATKRSQTVRIPTVIDSFTASKIAERRSQEALGKPASYNIKALKEASAYFPGQSIRITDDGALLRIVSVKESTEGNDVTINATSEIYGIPESIGDVTGEGPGIAALPSADIFFDIVEIPRDMGPGGNKLTILRVRESAATTSANIYISYDNTTFSLDGNSPGAVFGGVLNETLGGNTLSVIEDGPTINLSGPDISSVLDLSGSQSTWRAGRQIAFCGGEWMYIRNITVLSSTQVQLKGVIRGRYSSKETEHAVGSRIYIFKDTDITYLNTSPAVGVSIYVKTQPYNAYGTVSLTEVTAEARSILGLGTRPLDPYGINSPLGNMAWEAGESAEISWEYRNGNSLVGAGEFAAGLATSPAPVEGAFTVRIYAGWWSDLKREVSVSSAEYEYTYTDRVADFGSDPASFFVTVTNTSDIGLSSNETYQVFTKI